MASPNTDKTPASRQVEIENMRDNRVLVELAPEPNPRSLLMAPRSTIVTDADTAAHPAVLALASAKHLRLRTVAA